MSSSASTFALPASLVLNCVLLGILFFRSSSEQAGTGRSPVGCPPHSRYPGPDWNAMLKSETKIRVPPSPPRPPAPPPAPVQRAAISRACGMANNNKCLDRDQDVSQCKRYLECSLSPAIRPSVYQAFESGHTHFFPPELGDPKKELLVPIKKPIMPPKSDQTLHWSPMPWPSRINLDLLNWASIPNGQLFQKCGKHHDRTGENTVHMYCKYFSRKYLSWHEDNSPGSLPYWDEPDRVFGRKDVRLVLDIGASTGKLALELYRRYGDRIVTVSTTLITAGEVRSVSPPFLQTISARGFVTVAMDIYSYYPFGESTFDVIHSSWAYTSGYSRHAILEMYRVLRPGGYLILTVCDKFAGQNGAMLLESMATKMQWKLIAKREMNQYHNVSRHGERYDTSNFVYQMPSYKYVQ